MIEANPSQQGNGVIFHSKISKLAGHSKEVVGATTGLAVGKFSRQTKDALVFAWLFRLVKPVTPT
jgi:hypothetical protein